MSKRAPAYALEPIKRFLEYLETADRLLHLSMRAISMSRAMPRMVEAIALASREDDDWDEESHKVSLERATKDAEFATTECDTAFPLLHDFTLVGMWGAFEASIEDLIVPILPNDPKPFPPAPLPKPLLPSA